MSNLLDEIVLAAGQADAIRLATGFWPVLGHRALSALNSAQLSDQTPAQDYRRILGATYTDPKLRPAVVEFWWEALHVRTILDEDDQADRVREYSDALNQCIEALAPNAIQTEEQMRWELEIAASTGNTARVLRILDELKHRPYRDSLSQIAVRMVFRPNA